MLSRTDFSASAVLAACLLAGCGTMPASKPAPLLPPSPPPVVVEAPPPPPVPVVRNLVGPVLAYADQVRGLQGAELQQEFARLNDSTAPDEQLRLALALIQTKQLYDLVRAQDLLQRVLNNQGDEAKLLHPLARLLAARFAEQRRVEDQLDRQGQQLRDAQRRVDQINDRLEALKEIERSLTSRPPAVPAQTRPARPRATTP